MLYSLPRATILPQPQRSSHNILYTSLKFAGSNIPQADDTFYASVTTPPLPRSEVIRIIRESIQRNHGKGLSVEDYVPVSIALSLQLEKFYSLEVIRPEPPSSSFEVTPIPLNISVNGKAEKVEFYVVQTADMVALEKVFDIISEVFSIMNETVRGKVANMKIAVSEERKAQRKAKGRSNSMTDTVEDCLTFLDALENDENIDILQTLFSILVLIKTDLFSWWKTVGILEVEEQWDKVVKEIMSDISEKEKKKLEPESEPELPAPFVIHTCGSMNPVVDIGDFNADEVRAALNASFERFVNDPNTIFV